MLFKAELVRNKGPWKSIDDLEIDTVGDSYDNALAETVNGYYKAELIRGPAREGRPWKSVEDELAS